MVSCAESPPYLRIQTLAKAGISDGSVVLVVGGRHLSADPLHIYPIEGTTGCQANDIYIPFWNVFGVKEARYDAQEIADHISGGIVKRVNVDKNQRDTLTDVQLALLGAGGWSIIAKSAYRSESSVYTSRVFNFTIHCPVTGGGMIRIAGSPIDINNPTFNPKEPPPTNRRDLVLQEAFNRTHRPLSPGAETRKRARVAEAEANMRGSVPRLPAPKVPIIDAEFQGDDE